MQWGPRGGVNVYGNVSAPGPRGPRAFTAGWEASRGLQREGPLQPASDSARARAHCTCAAARRKPGGGGPEAEAGGRGRKWRRRRRRQRWLRRTGRVGTAGWRWMQQVTGPAGAASGDDLRGREGRLPGSWKVRGADGTSTPGITGGRHVWPGLCGLRGRTWGLDSHLLSSSSTLSSPQRDGLRSDRECFSRSSSPRDSQHLRPLDSHALPGRAACAG